MRDPRERLRDVLEAIDRIVRGEALEAFDPVEAYRLFQAVRQRVRLAADECGPEILCRWVRAGFDGLVTLSLIHI